MTAPDTPVCTVRVRVVHLITGLDIGGAEMMLTRLVQRFDPAQVESTVVSLTAGGALASVMASHGARVFSLDMRPGRPSLRAVAQLIRILRATRPHVLQSWLYHADFLGLIAGTLARVPAVVWNIRCSQLNFRDYSRSLPLIVSALARSSSWPAAVVCNSTAGQQIHHDLGYRPARWVLIPNGVDTDIFKPSAAAAASFRRELGVAPAAPLIGLVARLHPMKDHATFLGAAALVAREQPHARFVMVGRGVPGSRTLHQLAAELGIGGCVHMLDERHDISQLVPALDVAVSSSDSGEGFPNAVIEAMACGVPCVVTDVGDSAAIVADTGAVVPPRNPDALAGEVLRMLTAPAPEREALAQAARGRVLRNYSLVHVTEQYQRLYEQLSTGQAEPPIERCAG